MVKARRVALKVLNDTAFNGRGPKEFGHFPVLLIIYRFDKKSYFVNENYSFYSENRGARKHVRFRLDLLAYATIIAAKDDRS
jgi:hypothetical protein